MNLICFPHYTCGGLLCDILSDTFSPIDKNGGIKSIEHNIGKIGDTPTVLTEFDTADLNNRLSNLKDKEGWAGTHCWPGQIELNNIDQIINVTTTTFRSKVYRWCRSYYHYFLPQWGDLQEQMFLDKARETAKNYIIPFEPVFNSKVTNIEFADIVDATQEFYQIVKDKDVSAHITRWQLNNKFLYATDFWNSYPVNAFYQAEVEVNLQRYYIYE